ncbi:restriction endonuclease [Microcoleus sp. PH2017_28_MFU_U_A]|uniref:restriction endonuclease n=1 Tax=Microcoleus sp. PH2017_28_MFU_U_A TaxID=2798838 RepID=UPI001DA491D4|nr:restriction endonuclease [Microcoleus sp. PH2017_28_MFU_U_A]MCC3591219.1 restriction endonuclease [Microcoleus sp. PH2017_28_MFU_U_A]
MNVNEPKIRFKVVILPEWNNKEKGNFWEEVSADLFSQYDWKVIENIEFDGMQTDIYIKHDEARETGLIECKFQQEEINAPTIFKLMGQALYKKVDFAHLLSTSALNGKAKAVVDEYTKTQKPFRLFIWSSDKLAEKFMKIHGIQLPERKFISNVRTITLLVTHKKEFFWIAEEMGESAIPYRAIIFATSNTKNNYNSEYWKKYFSTNEIWENLEITVFDETLTEHENKSTNESFSEVKKVIVSNINQAENFYDYHRPCRPQDFFGRCKPQDEFWNFVKNVRDEETDLRVVSFSGSTGLGKSSLVLKLASDCRQKPEYKDNFYIHHVDVTSINQEKATLFVIAVIRKALQEAIDSGFVDLPDHQVSIESAEPPYFDSKSIKLLIETLKKSGKVIVIFFDQFEEILTKDSLSYLYGLFEQAAKEVDSLKQNIVLGFCWRTDVNLSAKHQAYFTWHNLAKIRKDIYFSEFSQQDSLSLLNEFENYLNQNGNRLQNSIKKWLLNNCQNKPWLLKRFCSDIYHQHNEADLYSEQKKVITKFDIKAIFDKDIERATLIPGSYKCLMNIAELSPVDKVDVGNQFNHDVINSLLNSKLVIQNGQNYKIYWDMFREYLLEDKLPEMTINYRPRTKISTVLKIFRLLKTCETISDLASGSGYANDTVQNAILDLQNFFQVTRNKENGKIIASEIFLNLKDEEIAEKLAEQIEAHVVIKKIYEQLKPGESMSLYKFQKLLSNRQTTAKDYASKMLSWFYFTGLLEKRLNGIVRPTHAKQGKEKGKLLDQSDWAQPSLLDLL